jgi:DNA-binding winged helix-turn-helix (wHTH) protein/TolB-like protein/tetratricopeptide (TPR) repeat protein
MSAQPFGNDPATRVKYLVGEFTIDTARYRISAGDTVIPVEPKVFDLLVHLIRHRDRVLTREELFKDVWDGREVSDATLSNHVKSARKVLGDNGDLQQTILTVRSRGYQFVAPVREIPDEAGGTVLAPVPAPAPAPAPAAAAAAAADDPAARRAGPPAAPRRWRVPLFALAVLLVTGMALTWRLLAPPTPAAAAAVSADRPYVLVVPFDVSGEASENWQPFADQTTREVIRNLRKVSGLRVVPVTSAFTFKGNKSRAHIRAQLPDVRYVLDGVVTVGADKTLHITAELEDLQKGGTVWDHDYTGRADDTRLFAMQSGIAAAVSQSLKVAILDDELRALGELPTSNLKAYELYVAGRYQLELVSHESLPKAIALLDQAIAMDPKFFDAYIARSDAYRQLFAYFEPPINMLQPVIDSIAVARELRPDSAEAWSSLGLTYVMAWRWKDAWTALNAAKRRDPTLAQTELGFALYYSALGEADKVKRALEAANRLDPLNAEMADWGNWALLMVGERDAARVWAEQKMRQHPDIGLVFSGAGVGASIAGDHERAVKLAERGAELDTSPVALVMLAHAYGSAGYKDKVLPLLEKAERAGTFVCPYESAAVFLSIGDKERAIALLGEAIEKRSNCLIFLRNDPRWASIRPDPRFAVLLRRVGLDDASLATHKR